jgi:nucleoside phosphorylase
MKESGAIELNNSIGINMSFLAPRDVKHEFRAHPQRALVITTVVCEGRAVKAHLTNPKMLVGEKSGLYEYGYFSDPAGDWLVVHAITPQGNTDAGLVASKAHQEFGSFHVQMFVGVAGSLKEDIPIGSVVIGDYVYNGHSAKVGDTETLGRPHGHPPARELLTASQGLIYTDGWKDFIRPPHGMELPQRSNYPCPFPPLATIKGIVSGEEIVAGGKSPRYDWLRVHFNDCGAVEMEGWGTMNAAHHENTPAIIVRGISDMCAGKSAEKDELHQPIAAAHAAAFAFSILSFRSKVPGSSDPIIERAAEKSESTSHTQNTLLKENRVELVLNFEGSITEWTEGKIDHVVDIIKHATGDETIRLIGIDTGSVRLALSVHKDTLQAMNLLNLRKVASDSGVTLLGVAPLELVGESDKARNDLATASVDLVAWEKTLPDGTWMDRPERDTIKSRFQLDYSTTVLLGGPGSGKSALLSKVASDLLDQGAPVFALKADFLSTEIATESDLQCDLQLPALPSELILRLAELQPVYIIIDQLDALASHLDLKSGRLNVLLNLVRSIGSIINVHVLLSARVFEFNHDVRLRAIEAESITLELPPWHEVKERLSVVGIIADDWPEKARDVIRIPQALKTFIALANTGQAEPFSTYQAMLEQLWLDRIASAKDSEHLILLASDLASHMAQQEVLWLAISHFDERIHYLERLEALGFIIRSENYLSVAFSHQTIFDYVLARTFVRKAGLLSKYVLERQDSLFIRPKIWSALNYLREAEPNSYEREFLYIWETIDLRRHLRILMIEFLGQVNHPIEFEQKCMAEVLTTPNLRVLGLNSIGSNEGWFVLFSSTFIRDAMMGSDTEVGHVCRILSLNWRGNGSQVIKLIKERWLPYPEKDRYTWMVVSECPAWNSEIEDVAAILISRTPVTTWDVEYTAMAIAVDQPETAFRLVRAKLDFLLTDAENLPEPPPFPEEGSLEEKTVWEFHYERAKEFKDLLHTTQWNDLPILAETYPALFLEHLWPWYIKVFSKIIAKRAGHGNNYTFAGQYILEIEFTPPEDPSTSRHMPVLNALQIAVEELSRNSLKSFLKWAHKNSSIEILAVQQLIARGFELSANKAASKALDWLLNDERRFQLGTIHGHRSTSIGLVGACVPYWSVKEIKRFEKVISSYNPTLPDHLTEPEQRRTFLKLVRATKKDLFQAVGVERLEQKNRELVTKEQRALGDRYDRLMGRVEGGFIGSPMSANEMTKAKDRDILKIFHEIPDNSDWRHPKQWMRGGNIQLSRAFAEFAKNDPERAIHLIEQFEPLKQERAAGYALDAMAEDASNDSHIIKSFLDLSDRSFQSEEFRDSSSRAIEKIASRNANIPNAVVDILIEWLKVAPASTDEKLEEKLNNQPDSESKDENLKKDSILWGYGNTTMLPSGNFNILSALASILLRKKEAGRDRYISILDEHLSREKNPNVWKAILYRLGNSGGKHPEKVSTFFHKLFTRFPEILGTHEAVYFLAHAQNWDDQLVFDLIKDWPSTKQLFFQRAYGELVGLVAIVKEKDFWEQALVEIITSGAEEMKIGLAHSAVNIWRNEEFRQRAGEALTSLLKGASKELVAAVMDFFRVNEELTPDTSTVKLLEALADPRTDLSAASSHFVIDRLQTLLPHNAELVSYIAQRLVAVWSGKLGDIRTEAAAIAPKLTDLALTLHRLGGASRYAGVAIFEAMIEIDAYGARKTLAEIDGRFGPHQATTRQRISRRRRPRRQRR